MRNKNLLFKAITSFVEDEVPSRAAQLSFYLIASFFPFIVLIFVIISSTPLVGEESLYDLISVLPQQTASIIYNVLRQVSTKGKPIAITSGIVSIWSMSNAMKTIAKSLNKFYDVEEDRNIVKIRILGIIFAILILITVILNFILLVGGTLIGNIMIKYVPKYYALWHVLRILVPFVLMIILFAFMYKTMPNRSLPIKATISGAIFTSVMWTAFSSIFSYYVNNFSRYDILYGSFAGIIVLFTWIFVTSYIILLGGEVNAFISGYYHRRKQRKSKKKRE